MASASPGKAPATESKYNGPVDALAGLPQSDLGLPAGLLDWDAPAESDSDREPTVNSQPQQPPPPALPPSLPPAMARLEQQPPPPPAFPATFKPPPLLASIPPLTSAPRQAWLSTPQPPKVPPSLPLSMPRPSPLSEPPALPPSLPADLAPRDMLRGECKTAPALACVRRDAQVRASIFEAAAKEAEMNEDSKGGDTPQHFPPGLTPPPGIPNHGSTLHGTGNCRPCAWFWKYPGCQKGQDCGHCHLCPEGEIKVRKKAKQVVAVAPGGPVQPKSLEQEATDALRAALKLEGATYALSELESTSASDQDVPTTGCGSEQDEAEELHLPSPPREHRVSELAPPMPAGALARSPGPWLWQPAGFPNTDMAMKARKPRPRRNTGPAPVLSTPVPDSNLRAARCSLGLVRPR